METFVQEKQGGRINRRAILKLAPAALAVGAVPIYAKPILEDPVILPVLTGRRSRPQAAIFSFWAGVMPPMPMLGRSLL
ncbi:hypothetical protein [Paracoccus ravus]|uniref:hypothetical protein n=1 Tax=Paracoccus ravus TaxID=2447760 RepID=UPI00106E7846|nr:hypothetical protein [Paracoccus ravus]